MLCYSDVTIILISANTTDFIIINLHSFTYKIMLIQTSKPVNILESENNFITMDSDSFINIKIICRHMCE